ncbi:4968_t:CDS:2, partial [Dentiscutata erythropus]
MNTDANSEDKERIQAELESSLKILNKLEYQQKYHKRYRKETQLGLLEAILRIVSPDGQADERRRSETLRSVKTLDQLQEALEQMNYKLSCSAAYFRLIPKWHNTVEGKRHVKTVSVKLLRAQNTARRVHEDTQFCAALIRNIKEMVSVLGPRNILVVSQDDKAQIPLGLAAANKQAPILIRLKYRVKLPDYNWVVAKRHKLIPSVYAILNVEGGKYGNSKAVTYSGPTFIRVYSSKHDSSTAYSHDKDFNELMVEEKLHDYTKMNGQPKPVMVMLSDGGPDENPRYKKTIQIMIEHFDKYDLDTIIMACFAPHQSASNPVERRMAPLSHDLASMILPHDTFELHLDSQLRTVDEKLENKPHSICAASMSISDNTTHFSGFLLSVLMERKLIPPNTNLHYLPFNWYCPTVNKSINEYLCSYCKWYFALKGALKYHTRGCSHKQSNLLVEPDTDTQDFQANNISIHNYRHSEFLVSNKNHEAMWIDEEVIPEDLSETYHQVQIQEELVADKVLIVDWEAWIQSEWTNE